MKATGHPADKVLSKPLVFLGGVTLEIPQVRNQVQPMVREGERGPLEEEGACLGPSLESKGVSFQVQVYISPDKKLGVLSNHLT